MEKISDAQLKRLSDSVARHLGLHFPKGRWLDLQRGVCAAAQEWGPQHGLDRYVEELLLPTLAQEQLQGLATCLTVGETYFFREKQSLEVLKARIVPELMRAGSGLGRTIRIWSAGCATGEEPYSVAIALNKLMAGRKQWNLEILATDLNSKSLLKASEGIYGEWSFRGTSPRVRSTYFEQVKEGRWAIAPAIKKMVTFAQLNLMDDPHSPVSNCPEGFDVIFCRNVLMYLTPEGMRKVVRQLHRSLANDGGLIVSPTEMSRELFAEFTAVNFGGVTIYRKSAISSATTLALPAFEEGKFAVPWPETTTQAPAQIPIVERTPEASGDQPCPKSTASPEISNEQALRLYEQGRYEDLEQVIAALPSQDGDHTSAMLLLARSYANQGKLAAALVWCDKAIAADKLAARGYYLRAMILQEQGSMPEVLLALQQAVYAEPEFVLGYFALGNLALHRGRQRESEKHFENVLLLLAQYEPEGTLPESEGLSAGRLREMIVSGRGGATSIVLGAELTHRTLRRAAKPHVEPARSR